TLDLSGTFKGGGQMMGQPSAPKAGYRLLGAIVAGPEGDVFFKLTGPAKTVAAAQDEFQAVLKSLEPRNGGRNQSKIKWRVYGFIAHTLANHFSAQPSVYFFATFGLNPRTCLTSALICAADSVSLKGGISSLPSRMLLASAALVRVACHFASVKLGGLRLSSPLPSSRWHLAQYFV